MRMSTPTKRSAFSLLEMVLAVALGLLLLLGLYYAFDTYLSSAQLGRDAAAEGALVRNIFARIRSDIVGQLGAEDPRVNDYTLGGAASADGAMMGDPAANLVHSNTGVYGGKTFVSLTTFRVRKANMALRDPTSEAQSDVSRIVYWVAGSVDKPGGLARTEIKQSTNEQADIDPTSLPDQESRVFAKEVKSIEFSYFDSTSWKDEWDGQTPPEVEGGLPPGPPAAISVKITLRKSFDESSPNYYMDGATYTQIIALPTSNSFPAPSTTP